MQQRSPVLYNYLLPFVTNDAAETKKAILGELGKGNSTQEIKISRLDEMLHVLNDHIQQLKAKEEMLLTEINDNPALEQYRCLRGWLEHYSKSLQRKLRPENCVQSIEKTLYNHIDKNDLDKMTALTFTLIFQARRFLDATTPNPKEHDPTFAQVNTTIGKQWAEETSHFSKFRCASGLALMVFGAAAVIALGIVMAPYLGIPLAIGATVLGLASKATIAAAAFATLYAVSEFIIGRKNQSAQWEMRSVPLLAGTAVGVAETVTVAATSGAVTTTAFMLGGMAASVIYGMAAFLRGGHLLFTSRASSEKHRQYAEKALSIELPKQEGGPSPHA